jgi:hypothetical protein
MRTLGWGGCRDPVRPQVTSSLAVEMEAGWPPELQHGAKTRVVSCMTPDVLLPLFGRPSPDYHCTMIRCTSARTVLSTPRILQPPHLSPLTCTKASQFLISFFVMASGAVMNESDPRFAELAQFMRNSIRTPAGQVEAGQAPAVTNIAIEPRDVMQGSNRTSEQLLEDLNALRCAAAVSQLWTSMLDHDQRTQRNHPQPYDISDPAEVLDAFAHQVDAAWEAMTDPLSGFYTLQEAMHSPTLTKTVTTLEVHKLFFDAVFAGFSLPLDIILQLDVILRDFVAAMKDTAIAATERMRTLNHIIRISSLEARVLVADPLHPVIIYSPMTTLIHLRIDVDSWSAAIDKTNCEEFPFSLQYSVIRGELDVPRFNEQKATFDKMISMITQQSLDTYTGALHTTITDRRGAPMPGQAE